MAATHAVVVSTSMASWDIDAMRIAGIAPSDLDNGVMVTLNGINADTSANIKGYEYNVAVATDASTNVYMVDTPMPGYDIETQIFSDPRYFYNKSGKPVSLRWVMPKVDCIEITAEGFASGTLPTSAQKGQYVPIGNGGKFGAPDASAPSAGAYFRIEGLKTIDIGGLAVPSVVLRCMAN